jgi:hypothetical protein
MVKEAYTVGVPAGNDGDDFLATVPENLLRTLYSLRVNRPPLVEHDEPTAAVHVHHNMSVRGDVAPRDGYGPSSHHVKEGSADDDVVDELAEADALFLIPLVVPDNKKRRTIGRDGCCESNSHMELTVRLILIVVVIVVSIYLKLVGVRKLRGNTGLGPSHPTTNNTTGTLLCGCPSCAEEWSCVERMDWLRADNASLFEMDACGQVVATYPATCGVPCDADYCSYEELLVQHATTPREADLPLYCFPPRDRRIRYTHLWGDKTLEVKESASAALPCGPRDNYFRAANVGVNAERQEVTLTYAAGSASEVRILLPSQQGPYRYGTYRFSLQSIVVRAADGSLRSLGDLPVGLVLSFFTWDPKWQRIVNDDTLTSIHHHQVNLDLGRWSNDDDAPNVQFAVPTAESDPLFQYGFDAGSESLTGQTYSFTWSPGRITWETTLAGDPGGFAVSTAEALARGLPDAIPCMPDYHVDVRLSLFRAQGGGPFEGLDATDSVEVVVDHFEFLPLAASATALANGQACSQSCQCQAEGACVWNVCRPI